MNARAIRRSVSDIGTALSALLLIAAMLLLNAQQVRGQEQEPEEEDFSECIDDSFAEYNSCLMDSGGWFSRLICDLDWEADVAQCGAEQVGQIRGAWEAH